MNLVMPGLVPGHDERESRFRNASIPPDRPKSEAEYERRRCVIRIRAIIMGPRIIGRIRPVAVIGPIIAVTLIAPVVTARADIRRSG